MQCHSRSLLLLSLVFCGLAAAQGEMFMPQSSSSASGGSSIQGAYLPLPRGWEVGPGRHLFQSSMCKDDWRPKVNQAVESSLQNIGKTMKSMESFLFGAIGGAAGLAALYPGDAVKMRMQAAGRAAGRAQFFPTMLNVIKNEGIPGLYKGLGGTVLVVAPEKATMFGCNAVVKKTFSGYEDSKGRIQMQLLSQQKAAVNNPMAVVKKLGVSGLYKGASATMLREVPFAALYFTLYSRIKASMLGDRDTLGFLETLGAATVSALPVSFITTPADVIKTRMQAAAGSGARMSIASTFSKIAAEEGFKGFFVGVKPRVMLKAPQLGVALFVVEVLTGLSNGKYHLPTLHPPHVAAEPL
ncbi:hypothetical protein GUITHDRAFT_141777 [Guillardia theta CCMP2712]|uniref:Uncharacterized protein n=1 Tax=Guillardia theta (strain CCMP2712) TaxID=905079 RepID=L1J146_GUITC|nr:hypothetical protein GUITHDRAFT_141777 [Guillardia theta CCMP2712]EKX41790.1 hypothetical protein GUITHDRAFT_141777 [Guillardia theta CCMP2712]|eukprot:XP_005828770.1 hypothetical protein GUITHDRAFT_141777 [Guillardia theta CCMP2712]